MAHRDDYEVTDYIFKVLLIGDKGVGKSSIVRRYVEDRFDTWPTTICVEYGTVTREINGMICRSVFSQSFFQLIC